MKIDKEFPLEIKQENTIDLSSLSFEFCNDSEADQHYAKKYDAIRDKNLWIDKNKEVLAKHQGRIQEAVRNGLIKNDEPETIWQYQVDNLQKEKDAFCQVKSLIKEGVEGVRGDIVERLGYFLSAWKTPNVTVHLTINEQADFCVDGSEITVDMKRLATNVDPLKTLYQGLTHEVFHVWMAENSSWSDADREEASDAKLKERIIFSTIDEGLAVLIAGQSLREHHEKRGKDYDNFVRESFALFEKFVLMEERKELERINDEAFLDMGSFYVVGYEMVKVVLDEVGIDAFRNLIQEARENPKVMLDMYKDIAVNKDIFSTI